MTDHAGETSTLSNDHCTISGRDYLVSLSRFIDKHESALAAYYQPRSRTQPPPTAATANAAGPSWGTILTLGILPDSPASTPAPPPAPVLARRDPLVLHFDPHHLYYVLLKFDELGLSTGDALDTKVDQGALHAKPMTLVDSGATPGTVDVVREGTSNAPSLFAGMFGFGAANDRARPADDSRSVMSGKSSFSFGSGWWGLGGGGAGAGTKLNGTSPAESSDETTLVRHVYSSCTKLPALKLSPFIFRTRPPTTPSQNSSQPAWQAVQGFEDCPPPSTCVPLSLFHSLTSLYLEDLDPRAFTGWDVISFQLKKLEVVRGGIEDVGELICDCVVEDEQRSQRRRRQETLATETVGAGRRKRSEQSDGGGTPDELDGTHEDDASYYPRPSKLAWSSLRHLSLRDNSLTFLPAPPLSHLSLLTSLDLSSNLLISVPPALAHLTSLRSLNLRDNMIDNLHALASILGAVEVVNLAHNRLENLSGLDRLVALERLDLRANRVWEAFEVSRLARLPNLTELWVRDNPFARDVVDGGEDGWRVKCLAYFEEERALLPEGASVAPDVRIDGKAIEGRTERKLVEAEVAKRLGGSYLPGKTMRRRASTGVGLRGGRGDASTNGNGNGDAGDGVQPKKVVVEPRRRVVTAPLMSATSTRQRQSTTETFSGPSLSSSPVAAPAVPSSPPRLKPTKRRKPRRIVDLDAPITSSTVPQSAQLSDSDATTSSGPEGGRGDRITKRASQTLATVQEPSEPSGPNTPSKRQTSSQQKFASSPSRLRSPAAPDAGFTTFDPSISPTSSRMSRRDRISASTYAAPSDSAATSSSGGEGGGPGGGGEALRRKIEKLRDEVGENWLSVLGEREARASQQQQQQQQQLLQEQQRESEQEDKGPEGRDEAGAAGPSGDGHRREEPSVEGLTVSAGVKVVKKKGKNKKGKGK